MSKKKSVVVATIEEANTKVTELKLALAKEKGLLVSKTKPVSPAKKRSLRKDIARVLTKKNQLIKKQEEKAVFDAIKKRKNNMESVINSYGRNLSNLPLTKKYLYLRS
jgi:large subunit ribosomal protein L29